MIEKKVAFRTGDIKNASKDFKGVIVRSEYKDNPKFAGKQVHIEIKSDEYDLNQHEWYSPSDKAKTKWAYLIEFLEKSGAMKDISFQGSTEEEMVNEFARSMLGMSCRFVEYTDLPSLAKNRETEKYEMRLIVPTEYYGKQDIGTMKEISIGEGEEVKL